MEQFYQLLAEEQFLSRFRNSLVSTEQFLTQKLKANKYDVEANQKRPKLRADIKYVNGVMSGLTKEILKHLEKKYDYEFQSVRLNTKEQVQREEGDVQRADVPQQEGGGVLSIVRSTEDSNQSEG